MLKMEEAMDLIVRQASTQNSWEEEMKNRQSYPREGLSSAFTKPH